MGGGIVNPLTQDRQPRSTTLSKFWRQAIFVKCLYNSLQEPTINSITEWRANLSTHDALYLVHG